MSSWAAKRRLVYFLSISAFVLLVIAIPAFNYFYTPPTCFDGLQNQAERGVDCGGQCARLCTSQTLQPIIHWQRLFEIVPTVYSVVAYVENPNLQAGAGQIPYSFKLYDDANVLLYERTGVTNIPPRKTFAVFEHSISIKSRKPTRVSFEFSAPPIWNREFPEEPIIPVTEKELLDETSLPRLFATVGNPFVYPLGKIEVTALIYDTKGNAIAASQTFIDGIEKDGSRQVVFTWPKAFVSETYVCEQSSDIALVIDRSGSMDDDNANPPEPLTAVKQAAIAFIERISKNDQVAVISFATTASDPIDAALSSKIESGKNAVTAINILENGSQQTNIGDGLEKALDELTSSRHKSKSKRVAVLLTDGIPNLPQKENDEEYPSRFARTTALNMRDAGVDLYTIGLGHNINNEFLKSIATGPDYFFAADTGKEVGEIYKKISSSICKIGPAVIEVITRIYST